MRAPRQADTESGIETEELERLFSKHVARSVWTPATQGGFFNSDAFLLRNDPWATTYLDLALRLTTVDVKGVRDWDQKRLNLVNYGALLVSPTESLRL